MSSDPSRVALFDRKNTEERFVVHRDNCEGLAERMHRFRGVLLVPLPTPAGDLLASRCTSGTTRGCVR